MKIQRTAMTMVIVVLSFYLLYKGQFLLLPLVVAGAITYLINILTHSICDIKVQGRGLPRPFAMVFAIAVILTSLSFLFQLISMNIASVIEVAPEYQKNLEELIYKGYHLLGAEQVPNLQEILKRLDFQKYLKLFGNTVRTLVSSTGIIIVYLIFLLVEQRTFPDKLRNLVVNPERRKDMFELIGKIRSDIRTYVGIKVLTSAATGLLSYLVLSLVGVDFASFWAVLIFLLNFIPTIGSIIATAFPSVLALVQFDTLAPFIITAGVLTAIQFCIGSLVEPKLMGNTLNLSPLVILLSLGLWGAIWGILGMFLCVPITVVIMIIFSYFPETRPVAVLLSGKGDLAFGPRRKTHPPVSSGNS
ncbi:MAG: AI-2E family transporter [Lentisphaeria bacterium]